MAAGVRRRKLENVPWRSLMKKSRAMSYSTGMRHQERERTKKAADP
jgi:hypothetical protein